MPIIKLKLGKGSDFVKSRLSRYPQEDVVWEADVRPIPDESNAEFWLGMVVDQELAVELSHEVLPTPPTVNDLARLLAHAIQRPVVEGTRCRPSTLLLRDEPQWEELLPHLRQLEIEVVLAETLPAWNKAAEESGIEFARTMLPFGPPATQDRLLTTLFPTVAKWVSRGGWIEIGERGRLGLGGRAWEGDDLVFECLEARTLDEAMVALEVGMADYVEEHGITLR